MKENSPSHSNFIIQFVQCSSCGTVVGTMDYFNIGARLSEIEKKIDYIKSSSYGSSSIDSNLDVINNNIARLFNYVKSKLDNK
ncbi:MAG: hypothetical protein Q8K02_18505 [Flavobacterium sp.]|nr:hypothetical protein [Flavobacterium sp.]